MLSYAWIWGPCICNIRQTTITCDACLYDLFHIFMIVLQLSLSDLNLIYACTKDKTLMIDVQAREISEKDLEAALRLAHPEVSFSIICSLILPLFYDAYVSFFRQLNILSLKLGLQPKLVNIKRNINYPCFLRKHTKK